ncbi:MAG TPA: hypothetical protein VGF56_08840 [Rhizomicrobium sp.]|jgi:hypothetical protein
MSMPSTILPYPGLRAFAREESMLFFGRENCVDAMIERLAGTRFLAVLGASGSGKSSLVRTGLFDGLELGFFSRAGARWKIVETHPGGAPIRNLAQALASASEDGDRPEDVEALLLQGRRSLIEWAGGTRLAPGENLLVLVDQFEELFRYADYAAREEAESFVALLLESARSSGVPIYIVITMRSEFIGACSLIPGLAEQINAGFYLTPRMSREECRRAIEGPAAVAGFEIESALTSRILNDMAALAPWEEERGVSQGQLLSRRADQLPLMQHLLNRLWLLERRQDVHGPLVLTVADYEKVGGLSGALDVHGIEILASLSREDRALVPKVFRALVSGPDTTNAVRRASRFGALEDELAAGNETDNGAARRIVDAFRTMGCNFLQPADSVPIARDSVIDISHESLIRQWTALSGWLNDEARAAANWRRLLLAADANLKSEGDLLSGLDLATLEQWWKSEHPNPIWSSRHGGKFAEAKDFLDRSRTEAEAEKNHEAQRTQRERRRLTVFSVCSGILALISCGLFLGFALRGQYLTTQRSELAIVSSQRAVAKQAADKYRADAARSAAEEQNARIELSSLQSEKATAEASKKKAESLAAAADAKVKAKAPLLTLQQQQLSAAEKHLHEIEEYEKLLKSRQDAEIERMQKDEHRAYDYCRSSENRNDKTCLAIFGATGVGAQ